MGNIVKMSIHRALSELKNYDDKIMRATQATFVCSNKKSNDKIKGKNIEDVKKEIQGNYDKAKALISNKKKIKSAVVLSNANTIVNICGQDYTVAEAIERKSMISLEQSLLHRMTTQFQVAYEDVENGNEAAENRLDGYLQQVLGEKDKRGIAEIEQHTKIFMDRNRYELINPLNIQKIIEELHDSIGSFNTEVDYRLSESNATTFIEVDLVTL